MDSFLFSLSISSLAAEEGGGGGVGERGRVGESSDAGISGRGTADSGGGDGPHFRFLAGEADVRCLGGGRLGVKEGGGLGHRMMVGTAESIRLE